MNSTAKLVLAISLLSASGLGFPNDMAAATLPQKDLRAGPPRTLNTLRTFPEIRTRAEWEARAKEIREQILFSCGLWPMPPRTPLNVRVFGRIERDGYSVEKVSIETLPGFFLAGNLYRPLGQGRGPFPGVLNPHGHWAHGRLEDAKDGSIPARCIQQARMGLVAFSYDMVGYNDTQFTAGDATPAGYNKHRSFATDPTNLLWNISLMGLQTWNSLRALDFLESLPDVDKTRLGCTGASGGGTQTFMLGAIEPRLSVLAPCVMVSHSMQGGCSCENAPGLRVDYSNMEIAGAAAPRPQILVAATGDWTKATLKIEGPAVESVYRLFGADDRLRYQIFDFDHNYNQTTREAVYGWFNRWLLNHPSADAVKEKAYSKEADEDLLVFPGQQLPTNAVTASQLTGALVRQAREQLAALSPRDADSLTAFRRTLQPAWRHGLQLEFPVRVVLAEELPFTKTFPGVTAKRFAVGRPGAGDRLPVMIFTPEQNPRETLVVLAHPRGMGGFLDESGAPAALAAQLLQRGFPILMADAFLTGELADASAATARKHLVDFFTTYNRTDLQERVQDLVTLCAFAKQQTPTRPVVLCGTGQAGLWSLLAAPAADAIMADANAVNPSDDATMLSADLFLPGLRRMGGFDAALALAAPKPALVFNTAGRRANPLAQSAFAASGAPERLRIENSAWSADAAVDWLAALR